MGGLSEFDKAGVIRERTDAILPNIAPSNVYPSRDGMVLIAANQDAVYKRLCEAMARPELAADARYSTHLARGQNQQQLDDLIGTWTATQSTRELLELMDRHGVPAGLMYRAPDMLRDPNFASRQTIVTVRHPYFGDLKMQNVAPKLAAFSRQNVI